MRRIAGINAELLSVRRIGYRQRGSSRFRIKVSLVFTGRNGELSLSGTARSWMINDVLRDLKTGSHWC